MPQPSCPEVSSSHDKVASSDAHLSVTGDVLPGVLHVTDDEEDDDSSLADVSKTSGLFRFLRSVIATLSGSGILLLLVLWMLPLAEAAEYSPVYGAMLTNTLTTVGSVVLAQLQCDTGSKEAEVKIRKMLNKHMVGPQDSDSLLSVLLATPTAKTPSVEKFLSHCRYRRKWLPDILNFEVGRKKVRRLRFHAFLRREATLESMVQMMTFKRAVNGKPKESKAIVVFGAAQCHSGFGYFPAPVKGLVRRLRRQTNVVILDEHYISKRCSKCAFGKTELAEGESMADLLEEGKCGQSHWKQGRRGTGGRGRSSEIHGVRFCPHRHCRQVWNRDVNSARNMRLLFEYMALHSKVRPPPFRHKGARTM